MKKEATVKRTTTSFTFSLLLMAATIVCFEAKSGDLRSSSPPAETVKSLRGGHPFTNRSLQLSCASFDTDSHVIQPSSDATITRCSADSTMLHIQRTTSNVLVDLEILEILDPEDGQYASPLGGDALAMVDGEYHAVRLEKKDEQPLTMDLKVKVGSEGATSNLLLCNLSKQPVELSSAVRNSVIYSVGHVIDRGSRNTDIFLLGGNHKEPDVCKDLRDGKRPSRGVFEPVLEFNAKVRINGSRSGSSRSMAIMNEDTTYLEFGSGSSTFIVRHEPGSVCSNNQCVKWNDKIWLAETTESFETSNCGWYGCRVARMDGSNDDMKFGHGRKGQSFYVRPKGGSGSGCVSYGEEVFLAETTEAFETDNCGWHGCRVFYYVANGVGTFTHGRRAEAAGGIYFSAAEG